MSRRTTISLLFSLHLLLRGASSHAEEGAEIRVDDIVPRITNDSLNVSATFRNLFSSKIVGTIQSGLPSILNIEVKVTDRGSREVGHKLISRSITYDIWEEQYSLNFEDTLVTVTDFEAVKRISSRLDGCVVLSASEFVQGERYRIAIRAAVIPISSRQGAKVNDWLLDPNQSEERVASDNRSSGFKFTLSNLFSFFVRDRRSSKYSSNWFSSDLFAPEDIR